MENNETKRLEFEALMADIAATFINLPVEYIDNHIEVALRQLVEFLEFDRATLFQLTKEDEQLMGTHCWAKPGFIRQIEYDQKDVPWILNFLVNNKKPLKLERVSDLPPEAETDREFLKKHNLRSIIIIPLLAGGKVIGFVAFGSFLVERSFPDAMINRMLLVGTLLSGALQRKNHENNLKHALEEILKLKNQIEAENLFLQKEIRVIQGQGKIIGQSDGLKKILNQIEQVARTDSTVLILGETGTGKELVARAIHGLSPRKERTLVCINCAGIPPSLIESELFGHEKGAFTGAISKQLGRFEIADGSTIFFDEIGELPPNLQAKLLRVIEDGRFERLGSPKSIQVNVRIIAATNRDLAKAVKTGSFREDLYYRLNVFSITIPPLRSRTADIPFMVDAFANEFTQRFGKNIERISKKDMEGLQRYPWPGNVRELRNVVERAVILAQGPVLRIKIPDEPVSEIGPRLTLEDMERNYILGILNQTGGRIFGEKGAAIILDINPYTLLSRMKKLGIRKFSQNLDI
ncbi:MAG: sigma 54-interacting transcriptional regulator [Deltaproteobacteria bacterium]|nr:sigma 54-interacting transcriptional regulator [Deltaproteobacteria bacterium]